MAIKITGDKKAKVIEDVDLVDKGTIKVSGLPFSLKNLNIKEKFKSTTHDSGDQLADLIIRKITDNKIKWKYKLFNNDPDVQDLAAGEKVTEKYKISAHGVSVIVKCKIIGTADAAKASAKIVSQDSSGDGVDQFSFAGVSAKGYVLADLYTNSDGGDPVGGSSSEESTSTDSPLFDMHADDLFVL